VLVVEVDEHAAGQVAHRLVCRPRGMRPGRDTSSSMMEDFEGGDVKAITASNYAKDHYYPKVKKAVAELLDERGVVVPVDLLIKLRFLSEAGIEEWRSGHAKSLEDVLWCDMEKAARLLEILRRHAHDLKLKPATTPYIEQRNGRRFLLHFSKKEDPAIEKAFSRHFVPLAS
jgi:hypothetical protein